MQLAELVSSEHRCALTLVDDVLDAMGEAGRRIEHGRARGHALVLHDLDARAVADDLDTVLDRLDAPDVEPDRRVELQRSTTRGRLRGAEHDTYFFSQLVDED